MWEKEKERPIELIIFFSSIRINEMDMKTNRGRPRVSCWINLDVMSFLFFSFLSSLSTWMMLMRLRVRVTSSFVSFRFSRTKKKQTSTCSTIEVLWKSRCQYWFRTNWRWSNRRFYRITLTLKYFFTLNKEKCFSIRQMSRWTNLSRIFFSLLSVWRTIVEFEWSDLFNLKIQLKFS